MIWLNGVRRSWRSCAAGSASTGTFGASGSGTGRSIDSEPRCSPATAPAAAPVVLDVHVDVDLELDVAGRDRRRSSSSPSRFMSSNSSLRLQALLGRLLGPPSSTKVSARMSSSSSSTGIPGTPGAGLGERGRLPGCADEFGSLSRMR
jgi:hypothetical protein